LANRAAAPKLAARRWRTLRPWTQNAALLLFVMLFVWSRRGGWPAMLVNLPMRVDPLAMLAHALSARIFLASSALALLTVLMTVLLGRVWCGWLCPLGTILDHSSRLLPASRAAPPDGARRLKYLLLLAVLSLAMMGSLTLLTLDPLTLLFRALSASVWPAVDQAVTASQHALYDVPALRSAVSALDGVLRPKILPPEPGFYRLPWLYGGLLVGVIALNLWAPRFWCRFLCPLGGLLGWLSRVSWRRRQVNDQCIACGTCARVCPTGTVQAEGYASDPAECTMCLDCATACPVQAIDFPAKYELAGRQPYDPGRRQALVTVGGAAAAVALFGSDLARHRPHPHLLRPPGARESALLSKCIRCGECSRACPTSAIQPAISEAGLEGLWSPILVPRAGYCDYSCHACGLVCPVQAVPPLTLGDKRQQVMGKAYINRDRCLVWSDGIPCGVCEEMCPVPGKAIWLEEVETTGADGYAMGLQRPHMARERCIGCGLCEFRCPVVGEAAIRVYVSTD